MVKRRLLVLAAVIALLGHFSFASDAYETGARLFSANKPAEAIPYLETSLNDLAVSPSAYVYLGIAYYQTGRFSESLDVFKKGLSAPGADRRIIAFNAGNSAYAMRDYITAEEMFTLSAVVDPTFASPVLNRANSRLSQQKFQGALEDYQRYLVLAPHSSQRPQVEAIIRALQGEMALQEQERERIAQEEQRMKEEAERKEAERIAAERAAEEAARKEAERLAAEKEEAVRKEAERVAQEEQRIKEEAERKEAERIAAERAAEKAEAERIAAEKAAEEARLAAQREADAERRRKLLEEVAASLQETETTGMNAGSEGVIEYEYESELD